MSKHVNTEMLPYKVVDKSTYPRVRRAAFGVAGQQDPHNTQHKHTASCIYWGDASNKEKDYESKDDNGSTSKGCSNYSE